MSAIDPLTDATHVGGEDLPVDAFAVDYAPDPLGPVERPSRLPTRKWVAARVTAVSTWLLAVLALPELDWNAALAGLVPIVAEAVVSYLTPNHPTVGGVRPRE